MQIRLTQLLPNNNVTGSDVMVTDVSGPVSYVTKQTTVDNLAKYITGSIINLELSSVSGSIIQSTQLTSTLIQSDLVQAETASVTNLQALALQTLSVNTNILKINSNYDLSNDLDRHVILVDASGSDVTASIPLAITVPNRHYIFKKIDNSENVFVISCSGGDTIDGEMNKEIIVQYETLNIISDGTASWFVL